MSSTLRCGVAGWHDPSWNARVLPLSQARQGHSLDFLSRHFDTAEITNSFENMPKPEISHLWLQRVARNPQFQFTARMHRQFTHERNLAPQAVEAFKAGLRPLLQAGKLGVLLMQLPWSFRLTDENKQFLIQLRRTFHEFPLAAELRHVSWMREEGLGVLIDHRIAFCNIDQPQYVKAMPPTRFLTHSFGVVRLHGRDWSRWFQDTSGELTNAHRYEYQYALPELSSWASHIEFLNQHAERTYVILGNERGGKSAVNALQMQMLLGISKEVPAHLRQAVNRPFRKPVLLPGQTPLFAESQLLRTVA